MRTVLSKVNFIKDCQNVLQHNKTSQKKPRSKSTNRENRHEEPQSKKSRSENNAKPARGIPKHQNKDKIVDEFSKGISTNGWYKKLFYETICNLDNLNPTAQDQGHVDMNFVLTPNDRIGKLSFEKH